METLVYPRSMTWHLVQTLKDRRTASMREIRFEAGMMKVFLEDGRVLGVPVDWFPFLENAASAQREAFQIHDDGLSVAWPEIGAQITLRELLMGADPCEPCWYRVSYFK